MTTPIAAVPRCCCFERQHEQHTHPAMLTMERDVLGCDFGGTSWTTRAQADEMPALLGLVPGSHLLEIGAGTGWPGIYLSRTSACDVTLLDVPVNSLRYARERARDEKLESRCQAVAASGAALPIKNAAFSVISHSDVLCCLPEKAALLNECRRVARRGAKMLFYVIAPAQDLPAADHDEACAVGPPFVAMPDTYPALLAACAWRILQKTDLTAAYLDALRRLLDAMRTGSHKLEAVFGEADFQEQLRHRARQVSAIERGLLVREMYLALAV